MPAQAGIHDLLGAAFEKKTWMPACAGMTT